MALNFDPSITGVYDDGTPEGVVKTRPNRAGELVKIPLRTGAYAKITNGGSVISLDGGYWYNEDGSNTIINLAPQAYSATSGNNGVGVKFNFFGPVFGIRWLRNASTPAPCCVVDGIAYGFPQGAGALKFDNLSGSGTDQECCWIVADDLPTTRPDGSALAHTATIYLPSQQSGQNFIYFFGLLVSRHAGYSEKPRMSGMTYSGAVPTSSTAIKRMNVAGDQQPRGVRTILYANTTASPVTVTVTVNLAQGIGSQTTVWTKSVPANDTVTLDLSAATAIESTLSHSASASGVNYTVIGAH
jgi:hypothetical protein